MFEPASARDDSVGVDGIISQPLTASRLQPGMVVPGRVSKITPMAGLNIQLFAHTYGRAFVTDLYDNFVGTLRDRSFRD